MQVLNIVMAIFSAIGALDLIFGNRLGIGKEFERGLKMFGELAMAIVGLIVLSPLIAKFLSPAMQTLATIVPFEPSVITSSFFANDNGGASIALEIATTQELGYYNGLVVGSMMGATVSSVPIALNMISKNRYKQLFLGLLCAICTMPIGCIVAGLMVGISFGTLMWNLIPLLILDAILTVCLLKFPNKTAKVFEIIGIFLKSLIMVGLCIGLLEYLLGWDFVPYTTPIEEGVSIVFNIAAVLTGALTLLTLLAKVLNKPLKKLGAKVGINEYSALAFMATLATSLTMYEQMQHMDEKGALLNAAFSGSAGYTFADHMAFTMSFAPAYVPCVIVGKLISGVCALLMAWLVFCRKKEEPTHETMETEIA